MVHVWEEPKSTAKQQEDTVKISKQVCHEWREYKHMKRQGCEVDAVLDERGVVGVHQFALQLY